MTREIWVIERNKSGQWEPDGYTQRRDAEANMPRGQACRAVRYVPEDSALRHLLCHELGLRGDESPLVIAETVLALRNGANGRRSSDGLSAINDETNSAARRD